MIHQQCPLRRFWDLTTNRVVDGVWKQTPYTGVRQEVFIRVYNPLLHASTSLDLKITILLRNIHNTIHDVVE